MSGTHHKGPILGSDELFGGAGKELDIGAAAGMSDMVTVFDDFNDVMTGTTFGAATGDADTNVWEDSGWVMTDDGSAPTAEIIAMNDPADVSEPYASCIRIFSGTGDDSGGNMQLDLINADLASGANHLTSLSGKRNFPHIWIPETGAGVNVLDNSVWTFACRVGFQSGETTDGDWEGKVFIGWAAAGDTSIMDHDTGVITTTAGNLHGFHIPEDGSIDGISKRITADALVAETNFTELHAAGAVDGTVANGAETIGDPIWYDLALKMSISDMSDDDANGGTEFFSRRVERVTTPGVSRARSMPWRRTGTLNNQTPNHTVALVPTIEVLNGPTAGDDVVFWVDWWAMGCSRYSSGGSR